MKDYKLFLFVAIPLLLFYLAAQYNKPRAADWTETIRNDDKNPFGTYILYHRIGDLFPGVKVSSFRQPVYNVIRDSAIHKGTYIIITQSAHLDKTDFDRLTQFVRQGNDVFIAANTYSTSFQKKLSIETGFEFYSGPALKVHFANKFLRGKNYALARNATNGYFTKFDTLKAIALGGNEKDHVNFLKYKIGKGYLYLNANPLLFTNYSVLQKEGADYVSTALSQLKSSKDIIWDEYYTQGRGGKPAETRVLLANPSLRWAFYIAFFSLALFVFYQKKRRQRIIPLIKPLRNSTVDFVNIVGQVYFEKHDNLNIAEKKITYFLEGIRARYFIKTNLFDKEFIRLLSQKTGADKDFLAALFGQITLIRNSIKVSDSDLILLNQKIEQFYHQSS